jgi:hypothetical protein
MASRPKSKSRTARTTNKIAGLRFKPHWPQIVLRAWSIRFLALAGLLSGLEAAFSMVGQYLPLGNAALATVTFFLVVAACIARLVAQKNLSEEC